MDESEFKDGMERLSRIVQANRGRANGALCTCRVCGHRWNARTDARPRICPACRSTLWDRKNARTVRCNRCGHEWMTSLPHPSRCPCCASDKWNLKTVGVRCRRCSSLWYDPLSAGKKPECPRCGPVDRSEVLPITKRSKIQIRKAGQNKGGSSPYPELYGLFLECDSAVVAEDVMIGWGFTSEQAGILHEFMCGTGAVEIARRRGKTLAEILDVVSPYVSVLNGRRLQ